MYVVSKKMHKFTAELRIFRKNKRSTTTLWIYIYYFIIAAGKWSRTWYWGSDSVKTHKTVQFESFYETTQKIIDAKLKCHIFLHHYANFMLLFQSMSVLSRCCLFKSGICLLRRSVTYANIALNISARRKGDTSRRHKNVKTLSALNLATRFQRWQQNISRQQCRR